MPTIAEQASRRGFEWDVAPLAVYKQYEDPSNPNNDKVVAQGKAAGHSNAFSACVVEGSQKREKAALFVKWLAGLEGQKTRANLGFFPNQSSLIDDVVYDANYAPSNANIFSQGLEYQRPGDWWYMPDHIWVEKWCVDLNDSVRNGTMTS